MLFRSLAFPPFVPTLLLVIFCSFGCAQRSPAPVVVTGQLHGELTWTGEVFIGGDVTLAAAAHLTILPGTVVRFLPPDHYPDNVNDHPHFPGSELNVAGTLTAIGTAQAPIVFAAADETAPPGSWGALNFAEGSMGVFRYSVFRQADSAVHSREATVEIAESLFEKNLVAIRFHTSRMRIERNLLRDNGAGLRFHFGAPIVRANRFENNRVNLFITSHPRDYLFENNHFGVPAEYHVVLGEDVPEDVVLDNNGWESTAGETVAERIFDGRRSPYLGKVEIYPLAEAPTAEAGPAWIR